VTTPNATTLYGFGFYDLGTEPAVILTPEVPGRYFSVQACDQFPRWFMMIGNQFTGRQAQQNLIIGPHFTGPYPEGFASSQIYQSASDAAWVACRYALRSTAPEEVSAVNALMDATTIVPLSVWEANGRRPLRAEDQPLVEPSYTTFPRMAELVDIASGLTVVDLLQLVSMVLNDKTMTLRSDSAKELDTLSRISRLGLRPGIVFVPPWLSDVQVRVAENALAEAKQEATQHAMAGLKDVNGWQGIAEFQQDINDYVRQGFYGLTTLLAPIPQRSHTGAFGNVDRDHKPLTGASTYTLTFDTDKLPPVSEFWELPLYDLNGYFVDNELDRYSINSFMLERGELQVADGKLTLYFQHQPPSDPLQVQNWLPTPEGGFRFAFRVYGPMDGVLDWTYDMPGIVRTGEA
jgi:hypothetical protein